MRSQSKCRTLLKTKCELLCKNKDTYKMFNVLQAVEYKMFLYSYEYVMEQSEIRDVDFCV